ncbi:MAG: ornithine cyclodeaminase family protein [Caulobacteraceae bacterium]|nr:ornithine cyclodeaminase family protein [Caulobacteraceae bacterium]
MKLRILSAADVRRLLPMDRCIAAARDAMTLTSAGEATQPIRSKMDVPGGRGILGMMPGAIAEPARLGIKVLSVFPGNFGTGVGTHQGAILLFDPQNGALLAVVDGREVTAIRTGAASAVATDVLANPDARTLGVFGYGEQAETHIEAVRRVRPIERVLVWGRHPARAEAFAREQAAHTGLRIETRSDPAALPAECEVICTTTAAPEPYFRGGWLRAGLHLNVVGSSVPTTAEVDVETITGARVYADFKDSALALGGDIRRAIAAGHTAEQFLVGEVGEVILGRVEGRRSAQDITLFKSLGMVSEDLTAAFAAYEAAEAEDAGAVVDF